MADLQTPAEAARAILGEIRTLPVECIPLAESLDRVLAQDVTSPIDIPPWDNSAMDGYALRSADLKQQATELRVVETIHAGSFPKKRLAAGECARIFTGAPLPQGTDSVIRQEDTTALDGDRVRIDNARDAGKNVRRHGEDIQRGTVVLARGTPLGPAQLGVLASIAQSEVYVYRRPKVAFLGSGDEIVELDEREAILSGKKVASSNSYTLHAMIRRAGGEPVNLGIARDDPADFRRKLKSISVADLLVTSAGVSMGERDYVRTVIEELGGTMKFWRIRMRPGAPVGFGFLRGAPWLGLPGNPVSTMVTFELFVRPVIRRMLGYTTPFRRALPVTAGERITLGQKLTHFLRGVVSDENGSLVARLTGPQGSGILTSMARANALLIVPEEKSEVEVGETLQAIWLEDPVHVEDPPF